MSHEIDGIDINACGTCSTKKDLHNQINTEKGTDGNTKVFI